MYYIACIILRVLYAIIMLYVTLHGITETWTPQLAVAVRGINPHLIRRRRNTRRRRRDQTVRTVVAAHHPALLAAAAAVVDLSK